MPEPQGVIMRIAKEPVIETQWLDADDGLANQHWTNERHLALVFPSYSEADTRAQAINALHPAAPFVYPAVVLPRSLELPADVTDTDFTDFRHSNGRQVLREEMRRRREQRQRRLTSRLAEMRADDVRQLDQEVVAR